MPLGDSVARYESKFIKMNRLCEIRLHQMIDSQQINLIARLSQKVKSHFERSREMRIFA